MGPSDEQDIRQAIANDRLNVLKAKERWQETGRKCLTILIGIVYQPCARFRRIGKRSPRIPSQQLYDNKKEYLSELEIQYRERRIDLVQKWQLHLYGGIYTVLIYAVLIKAIRKIRLDTLGQNRTPQHMENDRLRKYIRFPCKFSHTIRKETVVMFDNAKTYRSNTRK